MGLPTRLPVSRSKCRSEGNATTLRSLLRLESPKLYKTVQANQRVRAMLNVKDGDESDAERDRTQRTLDDAQQMPCLQGMQASSTEPAMDAKSRYEEQNNGQKQIRAENELCRRVE
jgi:hypothetical protein